MSEKDYDTARSQTVIRAITRLSIIMDNETKWIFYFDPTESTTERIRKLEALLAHKAAHGEPINDTIRALHVLRSNHQGLVARVFMLWVKRSRFGCRKGASPLVSVTNNRDNTILDFLIFIWILSLIALCLICTFDRYLSNQGLIKIAPPSIIKPQSINPLK